MQDAYRYLSVKDGGQARKAALLACILMAVGPLIWFIPPMAAAVIEPNIAARFPLLKNPSEAAYIFMGMKTMPIGMLGLLLCGIFAATMSSMDSGLNRNSGIFVKNFYNPIFKPDASPTHLLIVGKVVSAVFGGLIILAAMYISELKGLDLFNIMMLFSGLIAIPYAMPLVWGIVVKRSPPWSGWSTVLVGFVVSLCLRNYLPVEWFAEWRGFDEPMSPRERTDFLFIAGIMANVVICSGWFWMTVVFDRYSSRTFKDRVDAFFATMNTPVDFGKEIGEGKDSQQGRTLGILCYVYGAFIALLALIPNPLKGRLCFVFCALVLSVIGSMIHISRRTMRGFCGWRKRNGGSSRISPPPRRRMESLSIWCSRG